MRTLLIDNYDSYTFNLFHLLGEIEGEEPLVVRNDEAGWDEVAGERFDNIVVSPGPGRPDRPRDVGLAREAILTAEVPVLGVCLGHQLLAHVCGGAVGPAQAPAHGVRSPVAHDGRGLFEGLPQGFEAVRYHSLAVCRVPDVLRVTATAPDASVMGLAHRERALWGVQFHPESVCTTHGRALLANFAKLTRELRGPTARDTRSSSVGRARERRRRGPRIPRARLLVRSTQRWCEPETAFWVLYRERDHAVWLDSARAEAGLARFSFIAVPEGPLAQVVRYHGADRRLVVDRSYGRVELRESVLSYCERELARLEADAPSLAFEFTCGFAGYLGYELRRDCGAQHVRRSSVPDALLLFCDRVLAFDHLRREVHLLALADQATESTAETWLDATERRVAALAGREPPPPPGGLPQPAVGFVPRDSPERYLANIAACQREIAAGESYEICLTTELRARAQLDPLATYRRLRAENPAPYGALLRLGEISVLSSSPERFLRVGRDRIVESKPIKGTAPRGADPVSDARLAAGLAGDPKSQAENLMIADLVRNDLGRVAELGSVHVPCLMGVESYATVHQLVTTVRARLRDEASPIDCIRAAFPGGSMTGAPKLRTMEIIDRLEARPRGVYSGALGYLSVNGAVDLSIVIRTLVAAPDVVSIGAGGAILALSDPREELQEMNLKAAPLIRAVGGVSDPHSRRWRAPGAGLPQRDPGRPRLFPSRCI